jgi:hypothetical protein
MILDKQSAEEFAYACHENLGKKLGISSDVPFTAEARRIDDIPEYLRKTMPSKLDSLKEFNSSLSYAFGSTESRSDAEKTLRAALAKAAAAPASYSSKEHKINIALSPNESSLDDFYSKAGLPRTATSEAALGTLDLPRSIACAAGMAVRAEAKYYAGQDIDSYENAVVVRSPGIFGTTGMMNSQFVANPFARDKIKSGKYRLIGAVSAPKFFRPVGAFECAKEFDGTKNAFAPYLGFMKSKDFEGNVMEGRRSLVNEAKNREQFEKAQSLQLDLPEMAVSLWYLKNPQAMEEALHRSKPMTKWSVMELTSAFITKDFNDMNEKFDSLAELRRSFS